MFGSRLIASAAVRAACQRRLLSSQTSRASGAQDIDKMSFFFDDDEVIRQRKKDHIDICLHKETQGAPCSFDAYQLPFKTFPEVDLAEVSTKTGFFDWEIAMPFVVSSMTGGEEHGRTINTNVAIACNREGIPFGLGSMRIINRYPEMVESFDVKEYAPDVPMFANVGAVQLNYGFGEDEFANIIKAVGADGLFIHVNALQEAVQPEGDTNFSNLVGKIGAIASQLDVPVIVKEVGHGFDRASAERLAADGVQMIDVAGVGGTSWSWIEGYRQPDYDPATNLGFVTRNMGIPADASVKQCADIPGLQVIAGGGIRNGVQVAKALALGADHATAALPFLAAALDSADAVQEILQRIKNELKVAIFSTGSASVQEFKDNVSVQ